MLEGKGRIWKATAKGGQVVYIPFGITTDSAYPFTHKETVIVKLDPKNKRLIIEKEKNTKSDVTRGIDKSYRSQNHTNLKTPKHKGER